MSEGPAASGPPQPRARDLIWARHGSPWESFNITGYKPDIEGWNFDHPYLVRTIQEIRPRLIAEIGVWKGASTLKMALELKRLGLDAEIVAVDTWLGSAEHWTSDLFIKDMRRQDGYPQLYHTFLANTRFAKVEDYVVPLPLDSASACAVLDSLGLRPDLVHIDAGHDYESVLNDLRRWYRLLAPGGMVICDDYDPVRKGWPEVVQAVDDFRAEAKIPQIEARTNKCRFRKPPKTEAG